MNKHLYRHTSVVLALSLVLLTACTPTGTEPEMSLSAIGNIPVLNIQASAPPGPRPNPLAAPQSLPTYFAELEAEYVGFSTLALSASYLERKIRTLIANNDGEGTRREIDFARYKHPQLLIDIMHADPELYVAAAAMPEVIAFRTMSAPFDAYMELLAGLEPGPTATPTPEPTPNLPSLLYAKSVEAGYPKLAMAPNGHSVAVYDKTNEIYAQRYNSLGQVQGSEFRVNTTTTGNQWMPAIAMDSHGNFVAAWLSPDGDGDGIYAQRYNSAGEAQGNEFRVNTTTTGTQRHFDLAMDNDGDFVVTWMSQYSTDSEVYAQRYNSQGEAQGNEFQVNTTLEGTTNRPVVAMDSTGNFVVVWYNNPGGNWNIYARRYNSAGEALGNEFQVNTTTEGQQSRPGVAMDSTGNFVVVWYSQSDGVYAQRYDNSGNAQGNEFHVGSGSPGSHTSALVKMNAAGYFLVAWNTAVSVRQYTPSGEPHGDKIDLPINVSSCGFYDMAWDAQEKFALVWVARTCR